jgi:hypothetical protein
MPDYIYNVRIYVDVNYVPRGRPNGVGVQQNQSNIGGYGPTLTSGEAPASQTLRLQQVEYVPNAVTTPPTAANIGTALTTAAADIQTRLAADPVTMAMIQNWAIGSE